MNWQEGQYARWMAALRMAAKGKTMADVGYDSEVKSILVSCRRFHKLKIIKTSIGILIWIKIILSNIKAFLSMQHPASQPAINPDQINNTLLEEYVAPRFLRKMKSKVLKNLTISLTKL